MAQEETIRKKLYFPKCMSKSKSSSQSLSLYLPPRPVHLSVLLPSPHRRRPHSFLSLASPLPKRVAENLAPTRTAAARSSTSSSPFSFSRCRSSFLGSDGSSGVGSGGWRLPVVGARCLVMLLSMVGVRRLVARLPVAKAWWPAACGTAAFPDVLPEM